MMTAVASQFCLKLSPTRLRDGPDADAPVRFYRAGTP